MGFFDKMLASLGWGSKTRKQSPSTAPQMVFAEGEQSLRKILLNMGAKIETRPCSIDRGSSSVCLGTVMLYGTQTSPTKIVKDIGGFCPRCHVYRCGDHSVWLRMELAVFRQHGGKINEYIETLMAASAHSSGQVYDSLWLLGCPTCKQNYAGEGGEIKGIYEIVG